MNFEETTYENEGMMTVQIAGTPMKFSVTKNSIPGYIFQHLEKCDGQPPLTGAFRAFGELCYGNQSPDLIISSEKTMKRILWALKPDQIEPMKYGHNLGFLFRGAVWTHSEGMGFDIDDDWVFMLNTKDPINFRLNGCYKMMELP